MRGPTALGEPFADFDFVAQAPVVFPVQSRREYRFKIRSWMAGAICVSQNRFHDTQVDLCRTDDTQTIHDWRFVPNFRRASGVSRTEQAPYKLSTLRGRLVKILLKACKDLADFFRLAEICHGVGQGVVVFEFEQRREFVAVQFVDADFHVL